MKKSRVDDILARMKEMRKTQSKTKVSPPVSGGGVAYSTSVKPLKEQPRKTTKGAPVPPSCKTFSKKGLGAAAMTVDELKEFIKKKAPRAVFEKYSRLQRPTREALCKILAEFKEGYNILYPGGNKSEMVETVRVPEPNNLEGMFNIANRLQNAQTRKNVAKIVKGTTNNGFTFPVSPASPASLAGSSPSTPNFNNLYNNNVGMNERERLAARNAYLRKLANKRVERDPMIGALSAANQKRFRVTKLKGGSSKAPTRKTKSLTPPARMLFNGGNGRAITNTTHGLTLATGPRVNSVTMKKIRETAKNSKELLRKILKSLEDIKSSRRTAIQKTRIRVLKKILADPKLENKLIEKEKYRATLLQRLGLESPPTRNVPKAAFSMMSLKRNKPLTERQIKMLGRLTKTGGNKPASPPRVNSTAVRNQYQKNLMKNLVALRNFYGPLTQKNSSSMNSLRNYFSKINISNFKLEGKHCMSYTKPKLVKVARLLTGGSIKFLESFTKTELCQIIKQNLRTK